MTMNSNVPILGLIDCINVISMFNLFFLPYHRYTYRSTNRISCSCITGY